MRPLRWPLLGIMLAASKVVFAQEASPNPSLAQQVGVRGVASCSARACHGGATPKPDKAVLQNEYTTWMTRDPHANAYAVLHNERSQIIARNLAVAGATLPAHQDDRCLACHAIAGPQLGKIQTEAQTVLIDGVGCESCHGPAGGWLELHTQTTWSSWSPEQKQAKGLRNLKNLHVRMQVCAGCHVGAGADTWNQIAERDAFHDIMAAGHPRLNFEFGSYLATLPKHWIEKDSRGNPRQLDEAKVWLIGQIGGAEAALDLLSHRAAAVEHGKPWPEFAEYDCFGCHHPLREQVNDAQPFDPHNWRLERVPARKIGIPTWGSWWVPMTEVLCGPSQPALHQGLNDLQGIMLGVLAPGAVDSKAPANLSERAKELSELAAKYAAEIASAEQDGGTMLTERLRELVESSSVQPRDWDSAAQMYLAVSALEAALREFQLETAQQQARRRVANELLDLLRFGGGIESPSREFDPAKVNAKLDEYRMLIRK